MRLILRRINEGKPCLDYESFCQAGTVNEKSHSSSKIFSCCTSVSIGKYFTQSYLSVKRNVDDLLSFVVRETSYYALENVRSASRYHTNSLAQFFLIGHFRSNRDIGMW